jgi:hypothetical protein
MNETEINYRGIAYAFMVAAFFFALLVCFISTSGCITAAKTAYKEITATPEPTPVPPTPTPVPTPTPTPVPTLSEEQMMAMTNGLHMGEEVVWKRDNVLGYKDMSTHVTVYGWRMFGTVNWRSIQWGEYFREGAGEKNKWLFVLVNSYSDQDMARMWGIQPGQFRVQIGDQLYEPCTKLLPQIRIKEMDEVWNRDHVENVKPYGYLRRVDKLGEHVEELGFIKAGRSNAWDGYLVFQIPASTQIKDVHVLASFQNLMESHWWKLE